MSSDRQPGAASLPFFDCRDFTADKDAPFLARLRSVLHAEGFFYLSGHGVAPPLIADVFGTTRRFFALATNGYVRAKVHDMVAPPAGAERFSVALLLGSRPDAVVPVIGLADELQAAERGLSIDPPNPIFREVEQNQLKSRLRSHPNVVRIHYPDLALLE